MVLVSMSCVLTVVVLNVFYRGTNGRRVPQWAQKYILQGLGRIVCSRKNEVRDMDLENEPSHKVRVSC